MEFSLHHLGLVLTSREVEIYFSGCKFTYFVEYLYNVGSVSKDLEVIRTSEKLFFVIGRPLEGGVV